MNSDWKRLVAVAVATVLVGLSPWPSVEAALVGYWTFDDDVLDHSPSGVNDGILYGAAYDTDRPAQIGSGKSLSFTGTMAAGSDRVQIAADPSLNSSTFTLSYWIKDPGQTTHTTTPGYTRLTSRGSYSFETAVENTPTAPNPGHSRIKFHPNWTTTSFSTTPGDWIHLAYVYDGSTLNVYADGASVYTGSKTITPSGLMMIGASIVTGEGFTGNMDDVAIWNEPLPEASVQALAGGNGVTPLNLIIPLDGVIGPPGTDAKGVQGAGNAVNKTGYASNTAATSLTTLGGSGPKFNFNSDFSDGQDRASGFARSNVIADRKFNSAAASPLILDMDNDANFSDEVDSAPSDPNTFHLGFGMHCDSFVTFDLDTIRSDKDLPAAQPFELTGQAGLANVKFTSGHNLSSAAILLDGTVLGLYDFDNGQGTPPYNGIASFDLSIPGDGQYLTFIGLTGLDTPEVSWDHIGFANVELYAVIPEPASLALFALGGLLLIPLLGRRKK